MADAREWGVDSGYEDAAGEWHDAPPETIAAFLEILGAGEGPPPPSPVVIVAPGRPLPVLPGGELRLEDGSLRHLPAGPLAADLPLGYHHFNADGRSTPLIVSPGQCWLADRTLLWGWAAQLYAARSTASWGIGDLADLGRLCEWSAGQGAGMALINPLHAPKPIEAQENSPYFASSRCFRNPLYLRIEDVDGAERLPELAELAAAGRALNAERIIDRNAVWRLKSAALEALYSDFRGDRAFDRYVEEQGDGLGGYATFCALGERHGFDWGKWREEVRRPDGPGIAAFAASREGADRIRYHSWVQWLLDRQLHAAAHHLGLVQDLAIGADAGGADAWRWQDSMALGVRVGAPPDEFNLAGQDWGLPPFDPWRLRSNCYQPFIELLRAGLRHAGGLRFDHVMGLFRLFWVPVGHQPTAGTYVRYPHQDLLDILALESHRHRAYIVGEDLGTVETSTRIELAARLVLSYRLLWFESRPPGDDWPYPALAAATTHDLPTCAGMWTRADTAARHRLGLKTNDGSEEAMRKKVADWIGLGDDAPLPAVVERVYRLLAKAPCAIATATLDDALLVKERPNTPATVDEWPNWKLALPKPLEELETEPLAHAIAAALDGRPARPAGAGAVSVVPEPPSGST